MVCLFFSPPSDNEISSLSETVSHIRAREAIYCCRMHLRSIVSLSLSACQSEGIHKPVTASEDKLRQQAVRVPGTAGCVGCLPPLSPTHPPSVHPPLFPPPCVPLPYWCGFRCCSSPRQHLFAFPLDPPATGTKGELAASGAAPARAVRGAEGRRVGALHRALPEPAASSFSHFA